MNTAKDDERVLVSALHLMYRTIDELLTACDGKIDRKLYMKARGMLPAGYKNSFYEKKETK